MKVLTILIIVLAILTLAFSSTVFGQAQAKDCTRTSTLLVPSIAKDLIPLNEMGASQYYPDSKHPLRQEGGLYGGGSNDIPPAHYQKLVEASAQIQPLDANGDPDPVNGKIGVIAVGMSNTRFEFDTFMDNALQDPEMSDKIVLINAGLGERTASAWSGREYRGIWLWEHFERKISEAGLTPAQVQVAWVKQTNSFPNQPGIDDFPRFSEDMYRDMTLVAKYLQRYPTEDPALNPGVSHKFTNIKVAYLGSRIYAGYSLLNRSPEPSSYESALAMRWLIRDQMGEHEPNQAIDTQVPYVDIDYDNAPVLVWGPYLWANGEIARDEPLLGKGATLSWECEDLVDDGVHPADSARQKISKMLLNFFKTDPLASTWFLRDAPPPAGHTPTPTPSAVHTPTPSAMHTPTPSAIYAPYLCSY